MLGITISIKYYNIKIATPTFITRTVLGIMFFSLFTGIFVVDKWEFSQGDYKSIFLSGNVLKAYYTLFFEAQEFDNTMTNRTKKFIDASNKEKKTISIQPIKHKTLLTNFIYMNEFSKNGEFTRSSQSSYYGLDSIYIKAYQ